MTKYTQSTQWLLNIYIYGASPNSLSAVTNLHNICEKHLSGPCHIEVIYLMEQPHLAERDQIVAIPTVVRRLPTPTRKVIGDLSNTEKTLIALQIKEKQ